MKFLGESSFRSMVAENSCFPPNGLISISVWFAARNKLGRYPIPRVILDSWLMLNSFHIAKILYQCLYLLKHYWTKFRHCFFFMWSTQLSKYIQTLKQYSIFTIISLPAAIWPSKSLKIDFLIRRYKLPYQPYWSKYMLYINLFWFKRTSLIMTGSRENMQLKLAYREIWVRG